MLYSMLTMHPAVARSPKPPFEAPSRTRRCPGRPESVGKRPAWWHTRARVSFSLLIRYATHHAVSSFAIYHYCTQRKEQTLIVNVNHQNPRYFFLQSYERCAGVGTAALIASPRVVLGLVLPSRFTHWHWWRGGALRLRIGYMFLPQ